MTRHRAWRMVLAAALVAGCSAKATEPDGWRAAGVLAVSGWTGTTPVRAGQGTGELVWDQPPGATDLTAPKILVAPDTVDAGKPFEVITNTVGMNGCWRADGQAVKVSGRTVEIKPYDAHSGAEICTQVLLFLEHRSTLVLNEPGTWTLRVSGRRVRIGDDIRDEPITAEKTIVVR